MGAVSIWNGIEVSGEVHNDQNYEVYCSSLTIDHSLEIPEMKPSLVELFKELFKHLANLDESNFSVEELPGGYSNQLLKVTVKEENGNTMHSVVRLNGPASKNFINRDRELQAIRHLSVAGFGPKLLGTFQNGMVQSFLQARTLTPPETRKHKMVTEIAKQLYNFHKVDIPGSKKPQLWNDILSLFKMASNLNFDDLEKQKKYDQISFEEFHAEIIKLEELTSHLHAPVVFAHNDLHCKNLMFDDDEEKLYFIDFEYSSYSYRGYDIGNYFNEYAGVDCDYSLCPGKDEQYHFFMHYLNPQKPNEVSDTDLQALYVETSCYMLVSHLKWGLWSLIQAKMSPIDFNYFEYFVMRYNEYNKQKNKCFSLAKSYISESKTT